jgi:DNA-directed RNA polymerase specialized sigma24 family protein
MEQEASLEKLIADFRAGDEGAAWELHRRFNAEMMETARRAIRRGCGVGRVDSEGVVQEAFRSFFSAVGKSEFDDRGGAVVGLLVRMVQRKCAAAMTVARRSPLSVDPQESGIAWDVISGVLGGQMTEQELRAEIDATCARLLEDLTGLERKIIGLFLGPGVERSTAQIARAARCSETTVRQAIDGFIAQLKQELEHLDSGDGQR